MSQPAKVVGASWFTFSSEGVSSTHAFFADRIYFYISSRKEFVMSNLLKVSDKPILTLSDLRLLGRQGEAIAYLDDGRQAIIKPKFAVVQQKRAVNGKIIVIGEDILRFHEMYSAIISIKRKHFIIAERIKRSGENVLALTGKGYHRKKDKVKK